MATRPYWSGLLRLSLVSLPVNIYSALAGARQIALHEIYRPTSQRVHHQNVVDGKPIAREDIVKGYEVEKGEYVLLEPDEIANVKVPSSKVFEIVEFVDAGAIDEVYYDTPYFVAPDGKAGESGFAVIREALRATGKVGIGQLAASGRERFCALKPYGTGMMLETLHYEDEVRQSDPYFTGLKPDDVDPEELDLAKELIKRKTAEFEPGQFHDHYREALQELIEAKREHRSPREVVEEKPAGKIINLMDALRKSVQGEGGSTKGAATEKPARKTKSKSRTAHGKKAG